MQFSLNVSSVFKDMSLLEAIGEAKKKGFDKIEIQNPFLFSPEAIAKVKEESQVDIVLLNSHPGEGEEFGLASTPDKKWTFQKSINDTLSYTFALRCNKVHILAGIKTKEPERDYETYVENLQMALEVLEEHCVMALIEPICPEVVENYFLDSFDTAVQVIKEVNHPDLKLLLDIYHLHKITGNVEENLPKLLPYAGHIQVSQAPGRTSPNTDGEIDYKKVFQLIKEANYTGYVGLEYFGTGKDEMDFEWIKKL